MKFLITILFLVCASPVWADGYSDSAIANAIFKAEGRYKAKFLYGIVSVHYKDETDARRICLNTIRNHKKRHASHNCGLDFISCLGSRYCPINCDNDLGTNKFWIKNVKYFLRKEQL